MSEPTGLAWVALSFAKLLAIFVVYLGTVAYTTLAERRISAWIQDRHGPNRVGPQGLFQPIADGIKNLLKEETIPGSASPWLFVLAPALAFVPAFVTWAVIPWGAPLPTPWGTISLAVADLPVGFLFILAISSLGVYGITLAGWSSNNKYSLLGGLRSSAQMVSYEIAMGLSTIPVLLLAGNVAMGDIVAQQQATSWNAVLLSVAFLTFLVSAFAETNRLPFDLPEAESELVAGYHTEYSAMKYSMFMIAEYANMMTAGAFISTLFLGGWDIPFTTWDSTGAPSALKSAATFAMLYAKTLFWLFFFIWVRWTLPRFRYDQLMALGWRVLLPLLLAYIVLIASVLLALDAVGIGRGGAYVATLFGVNVAVVAVVAFWLDRGRLVSPAASRLQVQELERLRQVAARRAAIAAAGSRGT
ncbi:MAG: NADH-quinone oxidoreductase subunit NuoH [Gemmatimonadetes bacterium]|jgi:NADH-quinone oxidoreductase subunit H|nr:NADH-quinone oxidoreductase subunit NuoH [Gemmatimonadota bacterium]